MNRFLRFFRLSALVLACSLLLQPLPVSAAMPRRTIPYTVQEQQMMAWVVQQEVRGASLEHKRIIARVIVNRVLDSRFPDTVTGVLTQKGQFTSIQNWQQRRYEPDADTRRAVWEVLTGRCQEDFGGALYFYAPRWAASGAANWFEGSLCFLFEKEGHRFFR